MTLPTLYPTSESALAAAVAIDEALEIADQMIDVSVRYFDFMVINGQVSLVLLDTGDPKSVIGPLDLNVVSDQARFAAALEVISSPPAP